MTTFELVQTEWEAPAARHGASSGEASASVPTALPAVPLPGQTLWSRPGIYEVVGAQSQRLPVICASPHSGTDYTPEFRAATQLDALAIRRSEDAWVDRIFAHAPTRGAPLLRAIFPRAFVDANREPFELDPGMFEDALPAYVNRDSPRAAAGLGTVPRLVASGAAIYLHRLRFAEAKARIEGFHMPYHAALARLVAQTRARFGVCVLLDCHSMPSQGAPTASGLRRLGSRPKVDIVLGDAHGSSCDCAVTEAAEHHLREHGFATARNHPYAGGYTTRHYGAPGDGVHALQLEINRALYMDEASYAITEGLAPLARQMEGLIDALARLALAGIPERTQGRRRRG